jgi:hypothetical protein
MVPHVMPGMMPDARRPLCHWTGRVCRRRRIAATAGTGSTTGTATSSPAGTATCAASPAASSTLSESQSDTPGQSGRCKHRGLKDSGHAVYPLAGCGMHDNRARITRFLGQKGRPE